MDGTVEETAVPTFPHSCAAPKGNTQISCVQDKDGGLHDGVVQQVHAPVPEEGDGRRNRACLVLEGASRTEPAEEDASVF